MTRPIIVFDSGIGGFSIFREIWAQSLPYDCLYLADQRYFPYGDKSDRWLADRLRQIARFAVAENPAAFVIACNTATVSAVEIVRRVMTCPVIGVEPVIKPLADYQQSLILMTHAAASSKRTRELLNKYGPNVVVYTPDGLASAIENNDLNQVKKIILKVKKKVEKENFQAIGLSCTHYPLVQSVFEHLIPGIPLFDPSKAVVHHLKNKLNPAGFSATVSNRFITTGSVVRFNRQLSHYWEDKFVGVKIVI